MKKIICICLLVLVMSLSACSQIEDTNGPDDYSVVTFSDDDILNGGGFVVTVGTIEASSYLNGKLSGTYSVAKISGIITVNEYSSKSSKISFNINFTCEAGNAMVVIVSDNEIVKKIEANQDVTFEVDNNFKDYEIKLVGESAKASIKYQVQSSN